MAPPLNRNAIYLNLAAFVAVSVFCISTDAPIIQQDILKRCQDTLLMHRLSIRGLSVDGRDVLLSGDSQSAILSPLIRLAIEHVRGVRVVKTRIIPSNPSQNGEISGEAGPAGLPVPQAQPGEIQRKIDQVLENQGISFKTDTTTLTPESERALDRIASYLAAAPGLVCEIRGYGGPKQAAQQNWALALQRALAAEEYLENKGIADWRLSTRAVHAGEAAQGARTDREMDFLVRAKEDVRGRE